jgi:hypothetical protein
MSDNVINIISFNTNWKASIPVLRYAIGATFIMAVTSLWNYELAYLTPVLSLMYIAPGVKPLTAKQAIGFIIILSIITSIALLFSEYFLEYPLVFMPLLLLALLWFYYTDKLAGMVKVFVLVSIVVLPLVSIDSTAIGSYVAINLIINAIMAIVLTQFVFLAFPWCEADEIYVNAQAPVIKKSEKERFKYAVNIVVILTPVLLLFFIFKLASSTLILVFIAILSMSPALANPKVGKFMIVANIMGGIFAIFVYFLLTIVSNFTFMVLLVFLAGLLFGERIFSKQKLGPVLKSAFSTFLLILGSVMSSDMDASEKVWTRIIQISMAVIYVVIAFRVLNYLEKQKKQKSL